MKESPGRIEGIPLRILVYPEELKGKLLYCAHCLDFDIVESGETQEESMSNLEDVIDAYIRYALENDCFDHLHRPAPQKYWENFFKVFFSNESERSETDDHTEIHPTVAYNQLLKADVYKKNI